MRLHLAHAEHGRTQQAGFGFRGCGVVTVEIDTTTLHTRRGGGGGLALFVGSGVRCRSSAERCQCENRTVRKRQDSFHIAKLQCGVGRSE